MIQTANTRIPVLIFFLACSIWLTSCLNTNNSAGSDQALSSQLLLERAQTFDDLSTFNSYVDESNLAEMISDSDAYTLFAPSDDAFAQLPDGVLDTLSTEALTDVLAYHVTDTALFASEFKQTQRLTTLQGEDVFLTRGSNTITINQGQLIAGNFRSQNGILHATNRVLFPDSYLDVTGIFGKRYTLHVFEEGIKAVALDDTLQETSGDGFTVFTPTNTAFNNTSTPEDSAAVGNLLEYHIIPQKLTSVDFEGSQTFETLNGEQVTIEAQNNTIMVNGEATITTGDLIGTNGAVHIIDKVLSPPEK